MKKPLTQKEKDDLKELSKKFSNTQQFPGGKYHLERHRKKEQEHKARRSTNNIEDYLRNDAIFDDAILLTCLGQKV